MGRQSPLCIIRNVEGRMICLPLNIHINDRYLRFQNQAKEHNGRLRIREDQRQRGAFVLRSSGQHRFHALFMQRERACCPAVRLAWVNAMTVTFLQFGVCTISLAYEEMKYNSRCGAWITPHRQGMQEKKGEKRIGLGMWRKGAACCTKVMRSFFCNH